MQGKNPTIVIVLTTATGLLTAAGATAQSQPLRQLISRGVQGKPVNEPAINQPSINEPYTFMTVWQYQNAPGQGEEEDPVRLLYAKGVYNTGQQRMDWQVPIVGVPTPTLYTRARNPDVILTQDIANWRFVVAGEASTDDWLDDAYVVRTPQQDDDFDPTNLPPVVFDSGQAGTTKYGRLGVWRRGQVGGGDSNNIVHLLVQNKDQNEGQRDQVFLRHSGDSGDSWSQAWEKLEVDNAAVIGYPSSPVLFRPGTEEPIYSFFAYADDEATYIDAAFRLAEQQGDFLATGFTLQPNIDVGGSQRYFDRSNEALAGDFGIRPFTSAAVRGNNMMYVVYHDFIEETQGDGDFDIFIVRGEFINDAWQWCPPFRINEDDSDDVRSDQFMPVIVTGSGDLMPSMWHGTTRAGT